MAPASHWHNPVSSNSQAILHGKQQQACFFCAAPGYLLPQYVYLCLGVGLLLCIQHMCCQHLHVVNASPVLL